MRILTLTSLYPSAVLPGMANHNRELLRFLATKHDVSIIAPVSWTEEWSGRRRGRELSRDRRAEWDGIPVEHPRYYYPPKVGRGWYGWCFHRSVKATFVRTVREFRPDLVYAPWAYPDGWAAVKLGHRTGLPVVLQAMGSDVLLLPRSGGKRRRTIEALCCADGIDAVSLHLADRLEALGVPSENVRVIYRGVDASRFHPGSGREARERLGLPSDIPLILFVGGLRPVKAIDVLIDACARLAGRAEFTCLIAGDGPLRLRLEQQAQALGISSRIRFLGAVANDQLPDWYRAASVFALPSHSEGVPNVLLEAAACGTPFVASRVGGIPEIAHLGTSRLVPAGDPNLLAEALAAILLEQPQSGGCALPTRTWLHTADELADYFAMIVANHRRPGLSRNGADVKRSALVGQQTCPAGSRQEVAAS
jgi:glycosyltransferase involved in cell wall biosynthesis